MEHNLQDQKDPKDVNLAVKAKGGRIVKTVKQLANKKQLLLTNKQYNRWLH